MKSRINADDVMATPTWRWLCALLSTSISFALLYAWKMAAIDVAGNLLLFWLWLTSLAFIAGLFDPDAIAQRPHRMRSLECFTHIASLVMTFVLVWFGHFATAAVFMIGWCAKRAVAKWPSRRK